MMRNTYRSMNQIAILHNLSKQKTILEVIEAATTFCVDVLQLCKSGTNTTSVVDCNERIPGPVTVCLIASHSVSVVEAFNNFGTKDVVSVGYLHNGEVSNSLFEFIPGARGNFPTGRVFGANGVQEVK